MIAAISWGFCIIIFSISDIVSDSFLLTLERISSLIGKDNLGLSTLNQGNFGKYIVFLGSDVFVNVRV